MSDLTLPGGVFTTPPTSRSRGSGTARCSWPARGCCVRHETAARRSRCAPRSTQGCITSTKPISTARMVANHITREALSPYPEDLRVMTEAESLGATPKAVALDWLLQRSPNILLLADAASVAHLRENIATTVLTLAADAITQLAGVSA